MALTLGGGAMNSPGRYLALLQPINGAGAASRVPDFTENPGQPLYQWDMQINFQYMPKDWITWWTELTYRHSNVPYWSGPGGVTPPDGNTGSPSQYACNNGSVMGAGRLRRRGRRVVPGSADLRAHLGSGHHGEVLTSGSSGTSRYPTPTSVRMYCGCAGSFSSFRRRLATYTRSERTSA